MGTQATLDKLKKKAPVRREVQVAVTDDDGGVEEITLIFQSIGNKAYDDLVSKYPPSPKQVKDGLSYDLDKFAPALVAQSCVDPELTLEDAKEIFESDSWNRGELMMLFYAAIEVNTRGHELPPTNSD